MKYKIKYSFPSYYLVTRKKFLGFIPYWSTIYYSGLLKDVTAEYKKLTDESNNNR